MKALHVAAYLLTDGRHIILMQPTFEALVEAMDATERLFQLAGQDGGWRVRRQVAFIHKVRGKNYVEDAEKHAIMLLNL